MPTIETALPEILDSYDWAEVFGEGSGGNTTQDVESPDGTSTAEVARACIAEVIASVEGENDGPEWIGVFELHDGRWLAAHGDCDYTGWDCQAGNTLTVAATKDAVIAMGLTPAQASRCGLEHPGKT